MNDPYCLLCASYINSGEPAIQIAPFNPYSEQPQPLDRPRFIHAHHLLEAFSS